MRRFRLPSILSRYLASTYARTAIATLLGVVAVVLLIDVADRAYSFRGPNWFWNVLRLYANLSVDFAYQVAPSALLLAAGITASGLRQTGELTAFHALGNSPRRLMAVILLTCAVGCGFLVGLNEWVVVDAARSVEEIKVRNFGRKASLHMQAQRWFRSENRIYNLRDFDGSAFVDVSLYEMTPDFRLQKRIDASSMAPAEDGSWTFRDARISTFEGGERVGFERHETLGLFLPESSTDFRIRQGNPRQMSLSALYDQIGAREKLGLSTVEFAHELHNRLAYPFSAVPGAFLALILALRRNRKGHLATALAEGIVVSLVTFVLLTVFRVFSYTGALPPVVAAWSPLLILGVGGVVLSLGLRISEAGGFASWRALQRGSKSRTEAVSVESAK